MASVKEYAYYVKANKIKLIERDVNFDNDPNSRSYGPGVDRGQWKSPLSTVTDGLQLEYTYAPTYRLNTDYVFNTDVVRFNGWGSNGENLVLFATGVTGTSVKDLSSIYAVDDWIYISGSSRWNGIHQVKATGGSEGILTLKTRYNQALSVLPGAIHISTASLVTGDTATEQVNLNLWYDKGAPTTLFINSFSTVPQGGLFSVTWESNISFTLNTRHILDANKDYTTETVTTWSGGVLDGDSLVIYNATREEFDVQENVDVMEDESFDIDLPDYLGRAIELYIKHRMFDEAGDFEKSVFYLKEFHKRMEKHDTSKQWGHRAVAPGPYAIR